VPDAGALYSWVWASTSRQLAHKLDEQWEQPVSEAEFDVIEQLEAETEVELSIECEDCGGSGRDPGSLNAFEPEDCPSCLGTGREMPMRRPAGRQVANPSARQEVA
jgi:DnaJ-class molecular chaperone